MNTPTLFTDDPYALFDHWMAEAKENEPKDANAMALATVGADGTPSVRIVLLKGVDSPGMPGRGFVFYTNTQSRKGRELLVNARAGLCFYWKSLGRQIRVSGPVSLVDDAEADAYYGTRPRGSRIGAWASHQSRPLADRETLEDAVIEQTNRFGDGDIPRPPHWSGYRVVPEEIEFWQDREYRLHDRAVYTPNGAGGWHVQRLYP